MGGTRSIQQPDTKRLSRINVAALRSAKYFRNLHQPSLVVNPILAAHSQIMATRVAQLAIHNVLVRFWGNPTRTKPLATSAIFRCNTDCYNRDATRVVASLATMGGKGKAQQRRTAHRLVADCKHGIDMDYGSYPIRHFPTSPRNVHICRDSLRAACNSSCKHTVYFGVDATTTGASSAGSNCRNHTTPVSGKRTHSD